MILNLKLINFRNFTEKTLKNLEDKNFIVWENWTGKTNILESIAILWNNSVIWLKFENLVKKWDTFFFLEYENHNNDKIWFSFDINANKKTYFLNKNKISRKKFIDFSYKTVIFSPIIMNLMYLSPSLRREFLDNILSNCFYDYQKLLIDYKKILKHRNKTLKNIFNSKSNKDEIKFWDEKFIEKAYDIYIYIFKLINFFIIFINWSIEYFNNKVENIKFIYKTKITEDNIKEDIKKYLNDNFDRDLVLWKTAIWPHVDDFDILLDNVSLINFASRWETKSLIIWLKLLETVFLEKNTQKKPILIIDDLLSELDKKQKEMLIKKIKYYQTFITSIENPNIENLSVEELKKKKIFKI